MLLYSVCTNMTNMAIHQSHIAIWLQFHLAVCSAVQPLVPEQPKLAEQQLAGQQLHEQLQFAEQQFHSVFLAAILSVLHKNNACHNAHTCYLWLLEEPMSS
jgi:hypothetical protein